MDYRVYSMPRCMSLWLSHALTFNDNTCYHDISLDAVLPFESGIGKTGSCETGIIGEMTEEKILLVVRKPEESIASMKKAYNVDFPALRKSIVDQYELFMSLDHKRIYWDELMSAKVVQDIQDYLTGESMPLNRIETLLNSNITVSKEYLNRRLAWSGQQ